MFSLVTLAGAMALVGGTVGFFAFPKGLSMGLKSALNLAETGMVYPLYMSPPFPTSSVFHLYAIKNPREILRGGKMSLELKGPFRYDAYLVREDISFSDGGEKLRFWSGRKLVPREDLSANFDEKIWLLNPILPSIMQAVRSLVIDRVPFRSVAEPVVFNSINLLLDQFKERLIRRTSPREILNGRKVELLESMENLASRFGLTALLPPAPPGGSTFGFAFVQNVTIDDVEIWAGVGRTKDKFAEVSKWKGKAKLDVWKEAKCNSIEGTNGELFKPMIKEGADIPVFFGQLCRSFVLKPAKANRTTTTKTGIRALLYEFDPALYQGARSNPKNKCFCDNPKAYDCQYDGLFSMSACAFGAPIFFSRANFKGTDNRIKRLVDVRANERLQLNEAQTFALDALTGSVLEVNLTIVAMFKVVRQPYMRDLSNVQNLTYAPLFASTDSVTVPYDKVWQVYFLQVFYDYHKPIMAGTAAAGLGLLGLKYAFLK